MSAFWLLITCSQMRLRVDQPLPSASSCGNATRILHETTRCTPRSRAASGPPSSRAAHKIMIFFIALEYESVGRIAPADARCYFLITILSSM